MVSTRVNRVSVHTYHRRRLIITSAYTYHRDLLYVCDVLGRLSMLRFISLSGIAETQVRSTECSIHKYSVLPPLSIMFPP